MVLSFQERRAERLERRIEELRAWRNAREYQIADWEFTAADGQSRSLRLGEFWPAVDTPVTMAATAQIPLEWKSHPVELELSLGGEGFIRLSSGFQAGLNPTHHRFPVVEQAEGGETIVIQAEVVPKGMFGSHISEPRLDRAQFVIPQREVRALERDLTMLAEAASALGGHEVVPFLYDAAELALSELANGWPSSSSIAVTRYVLGYDDGLGNGRNIVPEDWLIEAVDAYRPTQPTWGLPPAPLPLEPPAAESVDAVKRSRRVLAEELEILKVEYPPIGRICLTGHAHIDLAWLWPLAETRRKTRRTFSTVLNLMNQYDDFRFNQSSAQAYAWIEEDDPEVFSRIKERVHEGRWEPIGGMWVESDANITGGESFVRQMVYGQRYFEQTFGRRNKVVWLPDVFGYSGGMPQLMRGAGLDAFFTTKINWNEANRFPHDLFEWEGVDGSSVTALILLNPGRGYNGNIVPFDTLGTWREYRGKQVHSENLLAFGWGDGAGGPTERMLENYERIKSFPALPRLRMGLVEEFFATLPDKGLPRWVGELYLELHRGTLTTQARTKQLNRESEHRLLEAEAFGAIASLAGFEYPAGDLETAWKTLLLNQFHDILPGSSINEVYQDTHRLLNETVGMATWARDSALATIGPSGNDNTWLVANAGISQRPLQMDIPALFGDTRVTATDGQALSTQSTVDGILIDGRGRKVPALGWLTFTTSEGGSKPEVEKPASAATVAGQGTVIENALLRVTIGDDGTIHSLLDKEVNRETLSNRSNQLWAYLDRPYTYDAWDIDETYERDGEEIISVDSIDILECGPLRASVQVARSWRDSEIIQIYRLWTDSRRLDIETRIEWHQRQILLKARFPLALRTHEATYETMYGVVRRPTHRNTSWDAAKFEVCGHRFADMSEPGYGVALLNDAKYGYEANRNELVLTLLRSPLFPDPLADEGEHRFTYSLFPHPGDWTTAGVTDEAFWLNSPLIIVNAAPQVEHHGFLEVSGLPLALGSLKPAFDGEGIMLRVYEPHGSRGQSLLRFGQAVARAERVNLLEEPEPAANAPQLVDNNTVVLDVKPFEVVTLRLEM